MVKHAGVIDQIRLIKQGKRSLVFVKLTVLVLHKQLQKSQIKAL